MKTVVLSFVYPDAEKYLLKFFESLSSQSDSQFDVLLINDGIKTLNKYISPDCNINIKVKDSVGTPVMLRKKGIEWVIRDGYDAVIFADADDYFSDNRVLVSKNCLKQHEIIFNELVLFGVDILHPFPILKNRFKHGQNISEEDIRFFNCLGMSNTAVHVDKIVDIVSNIPDSIIAFDWLLFTMILNAGLTAFFTEETITFYRQHALNIASLCNLDNQYIIRGVSVKVKHYSTLSQFNWWYNSQAKKYENLLNKLNNDKSFNDRYCKAIKLSAPLNSLWWEAIKLEEELEL